MPKQRGDTSNRKAIKPQDETMRTCLRCDREFLSSGKDNRLCAECLKKNRKYSEDEPYRKITRQHPYRRKSWEE